MKRILVPTDFSEQAENALKVAAQLAKKNDGEIFLLHMLELPLALIDPTNGSQSRDLPESIFFMKLAHQKFENMMSQPYLNGLKVHETVHFHEAFEGIMEVSQEHNCDLIVMGSHGASGLKEMFIGSNTEKVVRTSEIPVLVIKNEIPDFRIDHFIYATDFSEENRDAFNQAIAFAEKLEAKIHLLYVNTANNFISTDEIEERMDNFIANSDSPNFSLNIYNATSVEKGILGFTKNLPNSLMAISTHGRKGLSHFFNGSISEDLVNHANGPVITFKI